MVNNSKSVPDGPQALRLRMLADGVLKSADAEVRALGGGVSSNVYVVTDLSHRFVVKQALASLKVKNVWHADVSRSISEQNYLSYVGKRFPGVVPALIDSRDGYFTMEYLGDEFVNWKELLLAGRFDSLHAALAGETLGMIHRISSSDREAEVLFNTTGLFHQLRTSPYLLTTGRRHPELRRMFEEEAERLESTRECLVHGDYSPKNILLNREKIVLLDCETAWYGDPSFDLAFLLSHLLLKALYHAPGKLGGGAAVAAAVDRYFASFGVDVDRRAEIEKRTAKLLPMLLLARVDGKSPVEYLTESSKRDFIRGFVRERLSSLSFGLRAVTDSWLSSLPKSGEMERSH